ncbi:MAG: PP0621 family protein, partial [Gammaproteobacteria bacterium]|nr:PP0621 family protein [Gammaproteobacteria bacterium]
MFRNLFILIAIIAAAWIIKSLLNKPRPDSKHPPLSKNMLQCEHCKTYLPEDEAIRVNNKVFCNQQHLQEWQN